MKQESNNLHVNIQYKAIDLEQKCNELCQYFKEELDEARGKNIAKVTKSISLTHFEKEILDAFCAENSTKIPDIVRCILWRDSAIPDALIIALSKEKLVNLDFLSLKKFTFNYLNNYNTLDEEEYKNRMKEKAKTYSIQDRNLVVRSVEKHYKKNGFTTYSSYIKSGFISLGIFPNNITNLIYNNFRSAKRETNNSQKFKTTKKVNSAKLSISMLPLEQSLFNEFKKDLIDAGITFSMIVKYRLIQTKTIDNNLVIFTSYEMEKCKIFTRAKPQISNSIQYYQEKKREEKDKKRITNNASITKKIQNVLNKNIQKGKLVSWIRKNVLDYYEIYPIAEDTNRSIVELYI